MEDAGMWVAIAGLAVMVVSLKFQVRRMNDRLDRTARIMMRTPIPSSVPLNKDGKRPVMWIGSKPLYTADEIKAELSN